jgi:hypothetical protein
MMREAVRLGASFVVKSDAGRDLLPVVKAAIRDEPFVRFRVLDEGSTNPEED